MAAGAAQKSRPSKPQITSKATWGELAVHTVTLPSSAVVKIKIPDLSVLVSGGAVPEQLKLAAMRELSEQLRGLSPGADLEQGQPDADVEEEHITSLVELTRWLVVTMVVEPELTEEDVTSGLIPSEDIEMLAEFASRQRVTDARGVRLGVTPSSVFEIWQAEHGCEEDCEQCVAAIELSSTRGA